MDHVGGCVDNYPLQELGRTTDVTDLTFELSLDDIQKLKECGYIAATKFFEPFAKTFS